jgi:hypothetical protein
MINGTLPITTIITIYDDQWISGALRLFFTRLDNTNPADKDVVLSVVEQLGLRIALGLLITWKPGVLKYELDECLPDTTLMNKMRKAFVALTPREGTLTITTEEFRLLVHLFIKSLRAFLLSRHSKEVSY